MSRKLRILACDDSLTIRRLVTMVLGREDVELDLAETGQKGMDQAKTGNHDLILLDYMLPDLTGKDVVDALAADFSTSAVPVVIMSAKGATIADQFERNPSVVDYLPKPFKPDALLSILQQHTDFEPADRSHVSPPAKDEKATSGKPDQRKLAARVLYSALKAELAKVPEWLDELSGQDIGTQLAKRILRGSVVDRITKGYGEILVTDEPPTPVAEGPVAGLLNLTADLTLCRGANFTQRVAGLPLTTNERRLASMIDGRGTIGDVYRRSGFDQAQFSKALASLSFSGLARMSRRISPRELYPKLPCHWVALVDPNPGPLVSSLTENLGTQSRPIEVRDLTANEDLLAELDKERPLALFLSSWADGPDVAETLSAIRANEELLDLPIAVMIDRDDAEIRETYLAAGANRVWAKPFHIDEVWYLILS